MAKVHVRQDEAMANYRRKTLCGRTLPVLPLPYTTARYGYYVVCPDDLMDWFKHDHEAICKICFPIYLRNAALAEN